MTPAFDRRLAIGVAALLLLSGVAGAASLAAPTGAADPLPQVRANPSYDRLQDRLQDQNRTYDQLHDQLVARQRLLDRLHSYQNDSVTLLTQARNRSRDMDHVADRMAANASGPNQTRAMDQLRTHLWTQNRTLDQLQNRSRDCTGNLTQLRTAVQAQNRTMDQLHQELRETERLVRKLGNQTGPDANATLAQIREQLRTANGTLAQVREQLRTQNATYEALRETVRTRTQLAQQLHASLRNQSAAANQYRQGRGMNAVAGAGGFGDASAAVAAKPADEFHTLVTAQNATVADLEAAFEDQSGALSDSATALDAETAAATDYAAALDASVSLVDDLAAAGTTTTATTTANGTSTTDTTTAGTTATTGDKTTSGDATTSGDTTATTGTSTPGPGVAVAILAILAAAGIALLSRRS